jgi:hypothetical protein
MLPSNAVIKVHYLPKIDCEVLQASLSAEQRYPASIDISVSQRTYDKPSPYHHVLTSRPGLPRSLTVLCQEARQIDRPSIPNYRFAIARPEAPRSRISTSSPLPPPPSSQPLHQQSRLYEEEIYLHSYCVHLHPFIQSSSSISTHPIHIHFCPSIPRRLSIVKAVPHRSPRTPNTKTTCSQRATRRKPALRRIRKQGLFTAKKAC